MFCEAHMKVVDNEEELIEDNLDQTDNDGDGQSGEKRYKMMDDEQVGQIFIAEMQNKKTKQKTMRNVETFRNVLKFGMREKVLRPIEELPANRLIVCIGRFYFMKFRRGQEKMDTVSTVMILNSNMNQIH